jgi:hypothetical protein
MANALYAKAKQRLLQAQINLSTATIRAALISNAYPQNLATDEFYSTISSFVVGTPQALTTVTTTDGVLDADDVSFAAVAAGSTLEAVVLYVDTGVAGTSPLLYYCDQITGFPLATSGGDIDIRWDNGAFKIFAL